MHLHKDAPPRSMRRGGGAFQLFRRSEDLQGVTGCEGHCLSQLRALCGMSSNTQPLQQGRVTPAGEVQGLPLAAAFRCAAFQSPSMPGLPRSCRWRLLASLLYGIGTILLRC